MIQSEELKTEPMDEIELTVKCENRCELFVDRNETVAVNTVIVYDIEPINKSEMTIEDTQLMISTKSEMATENIQRSVYSVEADAEGARTFQCYNCKFVAESITALQSHMGKHSTDDICSYTLIRRATYKCNKCSLIIRN